MKSLENRNIGGADGILNLAAEDKFLQGQVELGTHVYFFCQENKNCNYKNVEPRDDLACLTALHRFSSVQFSSVQASVRLSVVYVVTELN